MKVLTEFDRDILEHLLELAGGSDVLNAAMYAVRANTRGPLQLSALMREIIRRRPETHTLLLADPEFAEFVDGAA